MHQQHVCRFYLCNTTPVITNFESRERREDDEDGNSDLTDVGAPPHDDATYTDTPATLTIVMAFMAPGD